MDVDLLFLDFTFLVVWNIYLHLLTFFIMQHRHYQLLLYQQQLLKQEGNLVPLLIFFNALVEGYFWNRSFLILFHQHFCDFILQIIVFYLVFEDASNLLWAIVLHQSHDILFDDSKGSIEVGAGEYILSQIFILLHIVEKVSFLILENQGE